jgi:hypothetical protein
VSRPRGSAWLDRIERAGNALPDPATLFLLGTVAVILLSQLAVGLDWSVEKTLLAELPAGAGEAAQVERSSAASCSCAPPRSSRAKASTGCCATW